MFIHQQETWADPSTPSNWEGIIRIMPLRKDTTYWVLCARHASSYSHNCFLRWVVIFSPFNRGSGTFTSLLKVQIAYKSGAKICDLVIDSSLGHLHRWARTLTWRTREHIESTPKERVRWRHKEPAWLLPNRHSNGFSPSHTVRGQESPQHDKTRLLPSGSAHMT